MKKLLSGLEPSEVFSYFNDLTRIPRCSGNERQISDYLVGFAKDKGLDVIQEPCLNVIIKKAATPGYENAPAVILQSHVDMVCSKDPELEFDFSKDPIPVAVEGDMVRTVGTTLGADNGIGVAIALAILGSEEISHPGLTGLFTVSEETGLVGASLLNPQSLEGDILINLDSEEEGVFLGACAGGTHLDIKLPVSRIDTSFDKTYRIDVDGLLGGHSGAEIDKNRANAIMVMGRLLEFLPEKIDIETLSLSGGDKMNAIPSSASVLVNIPGKNIEDFIGLIKEFTQSIKREYRVADPDLRIKAEPAEKADKVLDRKSSGALLDLLRLIPAGVQTMSEDIPGLVESSINPGVLTENDGVITLSCLIRSSLGSLRQEIHKRVERLAALVGAEIEVISDYPEWEFKSDSYIRDLMAETWKELYDNPPKVTAIHAGLECGIIGAKKPGLDMVSLGPDTFNVHTPRENISISSVNRVYKFLVELLSKVK